jgi:CheY-like chemotaxis protein
MSNILIIEDEDFLTQALEDNLVLEGYVIEKAVDGQEAVEKIIKSKPDLVLLDLLMPKKDGFYVLEKIRNDSVCRNIPIIALSNLGEDMVIEKAKAAGVKDYLIKSEHSVEDIIKKVKEYIKD